MCECMAPGMTSLQTLVQSMLKYYRQWDHPLRWAPLSLVAVAVGVVCKPKPKPAPQPEASIIAPITTQWDWVQ